MANEMLCFNCLTDDNRQVAAVTAFNGTTLCEPCARERSEAMKSMSFEPPPMPRITGGGAGRIGGF